MSKSDVRTMYFSKYTPQEVSGVFGPKSNSKLASDLQRRDPATYVAMKQTAVYRDGLVPETMLPLKSRLTPEQLEENYRVGTAEAKDDSINVPDELADRLNIPRGSRMKFDALQSLMK